MSLFSRAFLASVLFSVATEASPRARPGDHRSILTPPWGRRSLNSSTSPFPSITAPHSNIWASLENEEVIELLGWLYTSSGLNLTVNTEAGPWDNTVGVTEILHPNKTHALAYLDGGGPLPVKNARVEIFFGANESAYTQNFIVGPIPVTEQTTIAPLDYIYSKGSGIMPNYLADQDVIYAWELSHMANISDITMDLFGWTITGSDNDTAVFYNNDPLVKEGDRIIDWISPSVIPTAGYDSGTLLPGGIWMKFDITTRDPTNWKFLGVLYDDVFYPSLQELRTAWEQPGFKHYPFTVDGIWAGGSQRGEARAYDSEPAPVVIELAQRYAVDKDANYIEWMDFSFFLGFNRDSGLTFHEIEYMNERIVFELALQEAHAHYAGNDPHQSGTAYLDTTYGIGTRAWPLVKGWDCPATATYLDTVYHENGKTVTHPGSICIFEQDAGFPLSRHTDTLYVNVVKNSQLVVRWIATIGNYDYFFDYVFALDGTVEMKVRASGYIQGAWAPNNEEYGYKIHDALSGSMHDHVINYKIDLDILGTANTLESVSIIPTTTNYTWLSEQRNTMKLTRTFLTTEDEGKINWPTNAGSMLNIVNKESLNKWGEYRGYRIAPSLGSPIHSTIQKSSIAKKLTTFTEHNLYVTRQKDTEPKSSLGRNSQDPDDPLVVFEDFFDGESLEQEDLVVWFNLGMHHVPHTGDLPNTLFTTAQSGVMITPHNYLLGDPSRFTSQFATINLNGEVPVVDHVPKLATGVVNLAEVYPELSDYPVVNSTSKWPQVYSGGQY